MITEATLSVLGDRFQIREQVVNVFLNEAPGRGNGDLCSKYIYYVEDTISNKRIFLKRPARLNKGFDFEVHVESTLFGDKRKSTRPRHIDIYTDLSNKKLESAAEYQKVRPLLTSLYDCQELQPSDYNSLNFKTGYPIDMMLKAIKWLFIEQDITYWNWSGRSMFYTSLNEI
ncbi:hypothetical protein [Pontibacter sp. SGAir0037]|uniref:hypothetical protein n=1 Tax=Pontibacter sp. SGAir0037 TaxID=2571030 RepID=UPI0010CD53E1|nr:hypothetical protein [Pontibacter sp. SGAir0037]QCR22855.1 hypothetical protein C1N53_11210 [Pontibacter sp. SGAir0037]